MGNHEKMYGICENKCLVEVSPKTDTDAVANRVSTLESEMNSVQTKNTQQDTAIAGKQDKLPSGDEGQIWVCDGAGGGYWANADEIIGMPTITFTGNPLKFTNSNLTGVEGWIDYFTNRNKVSNYNQEIYGVKVKSAIYYNEIEHSSYKVTSSQKRLMDTVDISNAILISNPTNVQTTVEIPIMAGVCCDENGTELTISSSNKALYNVYLRNCKIKIDPINGNTATAYANSLITKAISSSYYYLQVFPVVENT